MYLQETFHWNLVTVLYCYDKYTIVDDNDKRCAQELNCTRIMAKITIENGLGSTNDQNCEDKYTDATGFRETRLQNWPLLTECIW